MIWELVENIYDLIKIKENDKNGFKFFYKIYFLEGFDKIFFNSLINMVVILKFFFIFVVNVFSFSCRILIFCCLMDSDLVFGLFSYIISIFSFSL